MSRVRSAVLAGSWYPADPATLAAAVDEWLDGAEPRTPLPAGRPLVALAPHAGFTYSGPTAGQAHAALRPRPPRRVVILAPNHRASLDRIALSGAAGFATPLGTVPVDTAAVARLAASPAFVVDDQAHAAEHAVEIQLPFLQRLTADEPPAIVPLLVPDLPEDLRRRAAADLAELRDPATLLLVSTDLTHFGPAYGFVPFRDDIPAAVERLDTGALLRVLAGDGPGLRAYGRETGITMCGLQATALALDTGLPADHEGALLDYTRSGDRDGDYSLSVSYAAVVLSGSVGVSGVSGEAGFTPAEREFLRELARAAVRAAAHGEPAPDPDHLVRARGLTPGTLLAEHRGAFVTLTAAGHLRGCIGYIEGVCPLVEAIATNARSAACADPRFPPVTPEEVDRLELEISVLSPLRPVAGPGEIEVGRHGVVLRKGGRSAVFLPQVAPEQGWDRATMLTQLALKAGLPPDAWRQDALLLVFEAEVF